MIASKTFVNFASYGHELTGKDEPGAIHQKP